MGYAVKSTYRFLKPFCTLVSSFCTLISSTLTFPDSREKHCIISSASPSMSVGSGWETSPGMSVGRETPKVSCPMALLRVPLLPVKLSSIELALPSTGMIIDAGISMRFSDMVEVRRWR
ncbi:hypothetical protein F5Y08DRAFT_324213 [Xylaria arbuscula]|nr:hypothetical protein F5Y08DRAFT_324213 [Xylaria arbuscula]